MNVHTKDILAGELRKAGLGEMADKAATGYYHDYMSPLDTPCLQLAADLQAAGTPEALALRARHLNGEFDATKEESDDWAKSTDGKDAFASLLGNKHVEKPWRAMRPNHQFVDEVRIVTVPRYKTSGSSGDEWRISATVQLLRKGRVIHERGWRNIEIAARFLDWTIVEFGESGKAGPVPEEADFCDQEGCANKATSTYRLKNNYCREGHATEPHRLTIRKFCDKHKTRGDCGLDDADANYEPIQ